MRGPDASHEFVVADAPRRWLDRELAAELVDGRVGPVVLVDALEHAPDKVPADEAGALHVVLHVVLLQRLPDLDHQLRSMGRTENSTHKLLVGDIYAIVAHDSRAVTSQELAPELVDGRFGPLVLVEPLEHAPDKVPADEVGVQHVVLVKRLPDSGFLFQSRT